MLLRARLITILFAILAPAAAFAQGTVLQGGAWSAGHAPMYAVSGTSQPVVLDSGTASGGGAGVGLSELGITARSANGVTTAPYANSGNGPLSSHFCMFDAPITNSTGYHYLCLDPNAQGGGLLGYGAGGAASALPLSFSVNGHSVSLPSVPGNIWATVSGTVTDNEATCFDGTLGVIKGCGGSPGTGTVTNVATGQGLSGGPITSTGTITTSPGVATNTLNAQTINYTVATSDCGKTVQMGTGSTGFLTVTLPAVSGFGANCAVTVVNGDSTRGKLLSGFPSDLSNILWPNQTLRVGIVNGAWVTLQNPGIWQAPSSVTLNVDHVSGSSSNTDCLATSGAGACASIYQAYLLFQTSVRVGTGGLARIQSDCGFTENPPAAFLGNSFTGGSGGGVVFIVGNEVTPSACSWTSTGWVVDDGAVISLRGFRTVNSGTVNWLTVTKLGLVVFANMEFGPAGSGNHVQIQDGGVFVYDGGSYQVGEGSCAPSCFSNHIVNNGGTFEMANATVNVPAALTFNSWYYGAGGNSNSNFGNNTFTGAGSGSGSTGASFSLHSNASLAFGGTTIPGTSQVFDTGACVGASVGSVTTICNPSLEQNINSTVTISATNSDAGSSAGAAMSASNGTHFTALQQNGANKNYGASGNDGSMVYSTAPQITIMTDNASGFINWATGGNTEKMRLSAAGGLSVGTTNDPGSGVMQAKAQTFASLKACASAMEGSTAAVTDSSVNTWGSTVTGSGANHVLAYCDGTNWTVMGK